MTCLFEVKWRGRSEAERSIIIYYVHIVTVIALV